MTYKRSGTKTWYATAYDRGKRIYVRVGPSKKVAEQVERDLKTQIAKRKFFGVTDESSMVFADFVPRYLAYSETNKRPESASRDARSLKALAATFGSQRLAEIAPEMVECYKQQRARVVKPATVNKELATLRHLFTLAVRWNYVTRNPVHNVRFLKEPPGRVRYLQADEYRRLLDACTARPPYLAAIVVCAVNTGLRQGEILNLTWADVNLRDRTVTLRQTKNNEMAVVPLNAAIVDTLRALPRSLDGQARVFGSWTRAALTMAFRRAVKRAGLADLRFHDLRHDFASQLIMRGVHLRAVQMLLRHRDARMTTRYAHLSQEHLREAVSRLGQSVAESGGDAMATRPAADGEPQ